MDFIKCNECGENNSKNSIHCSFCGIKLWNDCPDCKAKNLKSSHFCNKCGKELKKSKHVKIHSLYLKIHNFIAREGWNSSLLISVIAVIISISAVIFSVWYDLSPGAIVYSEPGKIYMQNTGPNSYYVIVPVTWENTGGIPLVVNHIHLLVYDGGENPIALNKSDPLYSFNILGEYDNLFIDNLSTAIPAQHPKMDSEYIIEPHSAQLKYLVFAPPKNFTYTKGHTYYFIINCRNNNNTFEGETFNITNFSITSNPPIGKIIPYKTGS